MRGGHPFKVRWGGRASQGVLINPEMLKFKIPTPIAFVPINPEKSPRIQIFQPSCKLQPKIPSLIPTNNVKQTIDCQKTVQNFNICVSNNIKSNSAKVCQYYKDYINNACLLS